MPINSADPDEDESSTRVTLASTRRPKSSVILS
jgi:hypothetical protein